MFNNCYTDRRVFVTGHTGFKGSWLSNWLLDEGAEVAGYSIDIPSSPSNFEVLKLSERMRHFEGDVRDRDALMDAVASFQPEIVFHLAAQSLVRRSYDDPTQTFETNAIGTMNMLECMRHQNSVRVGVIITSDKCYENQEWSWGYRENDRLGGEDPYSASKACAEIISSAYIRSYFHLGNIRIATTRAGNVIGGGDWSVDRIIPDCVRAWAKNETVNIRNPEATRPWQHVLEPVSGYLWLGAKLWQGDELVKNESFNFGPSLAVDRSVQEVIMEFAKYWEDAKWEIRPVTNTKKRENKLLKLSCDKALDLLEWKAALSFEETVKLAAEWYRAYYDQSASMVDVTSEQISAYVKCAQDQGLPWTK